jgi:DNA polymerase-3 subunit delta
MDCLTFLEKPPRGSPRPLYVVHGDEDFLRRRAVQAIKAWVAAGDDAAISVYPGDKATFAAVFDDLQTAPFFGDRRLVVVEGADPFIQRHRDLLEKAVKHLPKTGVLVLDVKSFPSNTRLYKQIEPAAQVVCKAPAAYKLPQWCQQWAQAHHGKQLHAQAASLLVELVGPEMGLLDQELEKLAVYVGKRGRIEADDVDRLVGRSRAQDTWTIFNAIGAGDARAALAILGRLFDQGEEPMRLLGAFSMQLRRLAQAARLSALGRPLATALEQAGVQSFKAAEAEQQLRHLGRRRLDRVYDWLLETDQGLKGGSVLPPRALLERLVVRLARKN